MIVGDTSLARRVVVTAALLALTQTATADGLRIATWNITNYYGGRISDIQTAVYGEFEGRSFAPDIIIAQEIMDLTAAQEMRDALNTATDSPGDWALQFVAGDVGYEGTTLFYRTGTCIYRGRLVIGGSGTPVPPRNPVRFTLWLQGYDFETAVLACYASHMKAGSTSTDQAERLTEARWIRDDAQTLADHYHFVLGADLNIQSSSEAAYQELIESQPNNDGRFFDPISTPGSWNNNCSYRFVHTQDPIGAGGMDDRYDQLLVSDNLIDDSGFEYAGDATQPYSTTTWNDPFHSYRAWGNDGTSCNTSLRTTGNTMVGATIAQALRNVATTGGHLPVFLDLLVPPKIDSDALLLFGAVPQDTVAESPLSVWNPGDTALWGPDGIADLDYTLAPSAGVTAPTGTFSHAVGDAANVHQIGIDTSTLGTFFGWVTIDSDSPEEPVRTVYIDGTVRPRGDMDCNGSVGFEDINPFVTALVDGQIAYDAQQPGCNYYLGDMTGDTPPSVGFEDINPFVDALLN